MKKFSLVLSDLDGCTAVVDSSKLNPPPTRAAKATLKVGKCNYLVEVLDTADNRFVLDNFEDKWSESHCAKAIDKEIATRQNTKSKKKEGGFLTAWPIDSDQGTVRETNQQKKSKQTVKEGSNGQNITVFHEGTADMSYDVASPKRSPNFFSNIDHDQQEIIQLQKRFRKEDLTCTASQTEKVVIFENDTQITNLFKKPIKTISKSTSCVTNTKPAETQTSTKINNTQEQVMNEILHRQTTIEKKLDEITSLLKSREKSLEAPDIINWINSKTPEGKITIIPASDNKEPSENTTSMPKLKIPSLQKHEASPLATVSTESVTRESGSVDGAKRPLVFSTDIESDEFIISAPDTIENSSFDLSAVGLRSIPSEEITTIQTRPPTSHNNSANTLGSNTIIANNATLHKLPCSFSSDVQGRSLQLKCPTNATNKEISSSQDAIPGHFEFRIGPSILAEAKSNSCSSGNFLWTITKKIYSEAEMVGRNYFGRKGRQALSPRRKHAIEHAYVDYYGYDYKMFTKSVNSINNGIRSLNR